jgi:hypothetical protein
LATKVLLVAVRRAEIIPDGDASYEKVAFIPSEFFAITKYHSCWGKNGLYKMQSGPVWFVLYCFDASRFTNSKTGQ